MKTKKRLFSRLSIVTKLGLMTGVIIIAVIGIVGANLLFTNNVGNITLTIVKRETGRVINNSRTNRNTNELFADVTLLLNTMFEKDQSLADEEQVLTKRVNDLLSMQEYKNETFYADAVALKEKLNIALAQGETTVMMYHGVVNAIKGLDDELTQLDETLADVFVQHKIKGKEYELFAIDQVIGAIPDYHNMLLRITMILERASRTYILKATDENAADDGSEQKILSVIANLEAGFDSTKNAGVQAEPLSRALVMGIKKCRENVVTFYQELRDFRAAVVKLYAVEDHIVTIMAQIDQEVSDATSRMENEVLSSIRSAIHATIILSGIIIVVVFVLFGLFISHITGPIKQLSKRIDDIYSHFGFQEYEHTRHGDEMENFIASFEHMASALEEKTVSVDALQKEQKRFADIAENSGDWIWETDADGCYTYSSSVVKKVLGYDPEEMIGRKYPEFFHPDDRAFLTRTMQDLYAGKTVFKNFLNRNICKNNRDVIIETSACPVFDNNDRLVGYRGVGRDVTERIKAEKERLRLEKELSQARKLESIGTLAAGIAHEINTPVQFIGDNIRFLSRALQAYERVVAEYQELIKECGESGKKQETLDRMQAIGDRESLSFIMSETTAAVEQTQDGLQRVGTIVNAMKDFSHMGQEGKAPADINKAIESTIVLSQNVWKYTAELKTDLDPELPSVPCFVADLNQVIMNLIINATHTIADRFSGSDEKGTITITTQKKKGSILISIADTGMGIPERIKDRIFDPFFTTKDVGKGTGQGLSLAYKTVIEKHNGKLWFETEIGHGTTFFIELPLK